MVKRKLFLLSMAICGCIAQGFAETLIDGIYYDLNTKSKLATVIGVEETEADTALSIPASIRSAGKTYSVVRIDDGAFEDAEFLRSVELPITVTEIGRFAFKGCTNLHTVDLPATLTSLEEGAFANDSNLVSVSTLGRITELAEDAFINCKKLEDIGDYDLEVINPGAFKNCKALKSFDFSSITALKYSAFEGAGLESVDLPDNVSMEWCTFMNCGNITHASLPSGMQELPSATFQNCKNLKELTLPNSLTQINESAFSGSGLKSIIIPHNVIIIDRWAFAECADLDSVFITNSTLINGWQNYYTNDEGGGWHLGMRYNIFANSGLKYISLPEGAERIGAGWFYGCENLESINIPSTVTDIQDSAFMNSGLKNVVLPEGLSTIGPWAFKNSELQSIDIPASVRTIRHNAFENCSQLESVNFDGAGESGRTIDAAAFAGCSSLKSVSIPWTVNKIGDWSFAFCTSLEFIDLPCCVPNTSGGYGDAVLKNCSALKNIVSRAELSWAGAASDETFDGIDFKNCTLYVPEGQKSAYKKADGWKNFRKIEDFVDGAVDVNVAVLPDTSAATLLGAGEGAGWGMTQHTLTVIPNYGYEFVKLVDEDNEIEYQDTSITFFIADDVNYTAHLFAYEYDIDLAVAKGCEKMGSVEGAGTHKMADNPAIIEAVPEYGYKFVSWNDGDTTNPRKFELLADTAFTATFVIDTFKLEVALADTCTGRGSVTGSGEYTYKTTTEIEAKANYGYDFAIWSDGSKNAKRNIAVLSDSTLTAVFIKHLFNVSASVVDSCKEMGKINGGGKFAYLDNAKVVATPNVGYHFVEWSNGDKNDTIRLEVIADTAFSAIFAINKYNVNAIADSEKGEITGSGVYAYGELAEITVTEKYGYTFSKWSNGNTEKTIGIKVTGDVEITAEFTTNQYALSVAVEDDSKTMGTVTGTSGKYDYKSEVEIEAIANTNYSFVGWNDRDRNTKRTIVVTQDTNLVASFSDVVYTVTTTAGANGSIVGGGNYTKKDNVATLTAVPDHGYKFVAWGDGETENPRKVTLSGDATFTASFEIIKFSVSAEIASACNGMGTVKVADDSVIYKETTTAIATANYGYEFTGWSNGSTKDTLTIEVLDDVNLTANFKKATFSLDVIANDNAMGSVKGAGSYEYLSNATISATPAVGHHFTKWNNDVTENPAKIEITKDSTISAIFEINTYELKLGVNNAKMGSVKGAGEYTHGTKATIIATPEYGYEFTGWNNGAKDAETSVVVTADDSITANFKAKTFTLDVVAKNGTVTGADDYEYLTSATISAKPAEGYHFVKWSNGETENPVKVEVASDSIIEAIFAINTYELKLGVNNAKMGSVKGAGTYNHGTKATIIATPEYGYEFTGWNNGAKDAETSVVVTADDSITANFKAQTFTLDAIAENGTVKGDGDYEYLSEATLTATPATGYHFVKWSNGSTENTITVTVKKSETITAIFAIDTFKLTVVCNDERGIVTGSGIYDYNTAAKITATPEYGYEFAGWSNKDTKASTTVVMTKDSTVEAIFTPKNYTLTLTVNNSNMGATVGGGVKEYKTKDTISAVAFSGYHFVEWSDGVKENERVIEVTKNLTLTATFAINTYELNAIAENKEMGSVAGSGVFEHNKIATITATPAYGYEFVSWSDDVKENPREVKATMDSTFTAIFKAKSFTLDVIAENGTATGAGSYEYNTSATVSATANEGYHFVRWSDGVKDAKRNVVISSDTTIKALFEINSYKLDLVADSKMGAVKGAGEYKHGEKASIVATPAYGYEFAGWSNGVKEASASVAVTSDSAITANFKAKSFKLDVIAENGKTIGAGSYEYLTSATISATANEGYHFVKWSNGETENPAKVEVKSDSTITANFEINSYKLDLVADAKMGFVKGAGEYKHGEKASIVATSAYGYEFAGWSNGIKEASASVAVTSDSAITANFKAKSFKLDVIAENGTATGAGSYEYLTTATISATANEGYHFVGWSDGAKDAKRNVVVASDSTIKAIFEINKYTLNVIADSKMGAVKGAGEYAHGATATVEAMANKGYKFIGWSNGKTDSKITLTITANDSITAKFEAVKYDVLVSVDEDCEDMGTVSGAGSYTLGETVKIAATANEGFKFVEWSDGETDAVREVEVTGSLEFTAIFEREIATDIEVVNSNNTISEPFDIYNMLGVKVKSGASFDDLYSMPKNVYIITNGATAKKVMIK